MKFYHGKILSRSQLKCLAEHKYSCEGVGVLDPVLQPFWNWLTLKMPMWLAPNLITVLGLAINIVTALILVMYSPDAKQEPPRWAHFLCFLGQFIYQSFDAVDGKQARRTGTANSLGELFDHGCDSVSMVFVSLSLLVAVQLGYYPQLMLFQCFVALVCFYCVHWQIYVSGVYRFGKIDVTEAQCAVMFSHLVTGVFGPSIWWTKVPGTELELVWLAVVVASVVSFILVLPNLRNILTKGVGKNGSTVAGTSVLSPFIPLSIVLLSTYVIAQMSTEHIYEEHPMLYILTFGLITSKATNRIVVAHMTRSKLDYVDWSLLGPAMLFLNQYFNNFLKEHYVLWLCLLWVVIDFLAYSHQICMEICDHIQVDLFRIPYSKELRKNSHSDIRFHKNKDNSHIH